MVLLWFLQGIVDQRLQESPENWRLVYKALLLLEFMVKHGPMVSDSCTSLHVRISFLQPACVRHCLAATKCLLQCSPETSPLNANHASAPSPELLLCLTPAAPATPLL
jgi:hypothetical protein